jgi:hypothetical protein
MELFRLVLPAGRYRLELGEGSSISGLAAFCIIGGLIFGILADQIFNNNG